MGIIYLRWQNWLPRLTKMRCLRRQRWIWSFSNDIVCFGNIRFLWSNGDKLFSPAYVDFVFKTFRLFLLGKETCFVWQSRDVSSGKTECLWCGEDEIFCSLPRMVNFVFCTWNLLKCKFAIISFLYLKTL